MNVKEQARIDLADACDAIEHLATIIDDMPLKQQVDVAARLRGPAKVIKALDESIKKSIKKELGQKEGTLTGVIFKAILKYWPVTRLNQGRLKDERPKLYEQYCETADEGRITFEPR